MNVTTQDEAAFRRVLDDYLRLWMASDAQACADLYDVSGDLLAVDGELLQGRDEIKRYYDSVMSGKYAGFSVKNVRTIAIRPLAENVALLDAAWEGHGSSEEKSSSTLVANIRCSLVFVRRGEQWKISAARLMVPIQIGE